MLSCKILVILIVTSSCSILGDDNTIKSPYDKNSVQYKTLKYYKKENQKEATNLQAISSMNSYYKVYTVKNTTKSIKEEYYKNNKLEWYKTFFYNKDNTLKSITYYNNVDDKIKELIYDKNQKISFKTEYSYNKDNKIIEKKRYNKNDKAEGWWIKYNEKERPIKRELYKAGSLKEYFTYEYDKNNTLIKEKRHLPKPK